MNFKKYFIVYITYAAALILLITDILSKNIASIYLNKQAPIVLIKGILEFVYVENRGVAFGLFYGKKIPILIISLFAVVIIFIFIKKIKNEKKYIPLSLASGAILAGAIGNIFDRIFRGYVVDFIYFKPIDFPVFNFADICISLGCFFIIILFLFVYKEEK